MAFPDQGGSDALPLICGLHGQGRQSQHIVAADFGPGKQDIANELLPFLCHKGQFRDKSIFSAQIHNQILLRAVRVLRLGERFTDQSIDFGIIFWGLLDRVFTPPSLCRRAFIRSARIFLFDGNWFRSGRITDCIIL